MVRRSRSRVLCGLTFGCCALTLVGLKCGEAWLFPSQASGPAQSRGEMAQLGRRGALSGAVLGGLFVATAPEEALASGGSTAGKYSTIPSAKRRFYGRVRQGLYQFLLMEKPIMAGNLQDPVIEDFFAKTLIKDTRDGGKKIDKQCGFGADCEVKVKRTSRWLDWKVASDLLASAFRYDANDVNDYLPQVKLIRAAHKKIDKMKTALENGDAATAQTLFKKIKGELNKYTYMVELEPLESEDYTHPWDTLPEVWCQGSFCI